jgi:anaerobic magnesium-protoporphyrin IX monomethyl ester cyclase
MKLLLVNAVDASRRIETVYPPLGLAYISSYLKKYVPSIEVKIVDRNVGNAIQEFRPDAVGVSSVTQNFGGAVIIGEMCKQLKIPVFIGGVHISMLPEGLPDVFDFGVVGEGENTMLELVKLFSERGSFGDEDLGNIRGLVLHGHDGPELTEERGLIESLDSIPFPDRELLDIPSAGSTYLFTSRGCPYKCAFCSSTRFWDRTRWFSAEYVVDEIKAVVQRYRPWAVSFYDDLFVANFGRLQTIVDLLLREGLHKKVKFSFACRSNLVNERLIEVIRQLDIQMICMGLESGCQRILEYLKGEKCSVEQNMNAIDLLSEANINVQGTFIIGSPDETEDEILETLNFIKRSKLVHFDVYILTPFPGTPIWRIAKQHNLVSDHMDWRRLAVDSGNRVEDKVVVSKLPRERLGELYSLFQRERRRRKLHYAFRNAAKDPLWACRKIGAVWARK